MSDLGPEANGQRCKNCIFYKKMTNWPECRRFPPVRGEEFPHPHFEMWCGEHKWDWSKLPKGYHLDEQGVLIQDHPPGWDGKDELPSLWTAIKKWWKAGR